MTTDLAHVPYEVEQLSTELHHDDPGITPLEAYCAALEQFDALERFAAQWDAQAAAEFATAESECSMLAMYLYARHPGPILIEEAFDQASGLYADLARFAAQWDEQAAAEQAAAQQHTTATTHPMRQVLRRSMRSAHAIDQAVNRCLHAISCGTSVNEQLIQPFRAGIAIVAYPYNGSMTAWHMHVWHAPKHDEFVAVPDFAEEDSRWEGHRGGWYRLVDRLRWRFQYEGIGSAF